MIRERGGKHWMVALLAHPFEAAFAVLFLVVGWQLVSSGHEVHLTPTQTLPVPLVVAWEICLLLGGPAIIAGLLWPGSELMGRAVERAGCFLAAAAWVTYAITIWKLSHGQATSAIAQGVTVGVGCLVRAYALHRVDKVAVKVTRESKEGRG